MDIHLSIGMLSGIIGAFCIYFGFIQVRQALFTLSWPNTEATITKSNVEKYSDDGIFYRFLLRYSYKVNEINYKGSQIRSGPGDFIWAWAWPAKQQSKKYPIGLKVRVYYSQENPEKTVLVTGLRTSHGAIFLLAAFALNIARHQFFL